LGRLGDILSASLKRFGMPWGVFKTSWGPLKPSCGRFGASLGRLKLDFSAKWI